MRTYRRRHRAALNTVLVAITLTACTSWRVQQVSPKQLVAEELPTTVRIQRADSSRVVLSMPQLAGDSLVGFLVTTGGQPTGVPLTDINQIAVRRVNALKTTGLILGILAAPVAAVGVICAFAGDCSFGMPSWNSQ